MDHLVSAHVMLEREQKKQLRSWAGDRDASMASLVREAIDYYLRVAVGPAPLKVRRDARDAVGVLPPSVRSPEAQAGDDVPGAWWPGEV
jgi:hypothetical protein